jgi:hypothetical protein
MKPTEQLLQALAVTVELTGTELSKAAARVMAYDLARYPEAQVIGALDRCRRELRGRLTIADVLARLEDGRPGPEEAWSMIPRDEAASVFWTEEMRQAYAVAAPLLAAGDAVPARMAFLERYRALVLEAREAGRPVEWTFSPGTDKSARELVLLDAVEKGRLSADLARDLLPYHREDEGLNGRLLSLASKALKRIEHHADKA